MIARDRTGISIQCGDIVRVKVGDGPECEAKVKSVNPYNSAIQGCVLVCFDNDSAQWMDGCYLEIITRVKW